MQPLHSGSCRSQKEIASLIPPVIASLHYWTNSADHNPRPRHRSAYRADGNAETGEGIPRHHVANLTPSAGTHDTSYGTGISLLRCLLTNNHPRNLILPLAPALPDCKISSPNPRDLHFPTSSGLGHIDRSTWERQMQSQHSQLRSIRDESGYSTSHRQAENRRYTQQFPDSFETRQKGIWMGFMVANGQAIGRRVMGLYVRGKWR